MGHFMNRRLPLRWANLYSTGFHGAGPIYIAPASTVLKLKLLLDLIWTVHFARHRQHHES
eukprot:scaffold7370_cov137-Skeletonema_dohrnii-CCMP3373.AAC.2